MRRIKARLMVRSLVRGVQVAPIIYKIAMQKNDSSLPNINNDKKGSNQFFQLDDFNSKESEVEQKPKLVSPTVIEPESKTNHKVMMNTSDNLKNIEDSNGHKNGTVAGSDHKHFAKLLKTRTISKDDTPFDQAKSVKHEDEKHDALSNVSAAQNEIIYKERKGCPKCPQSVTKVINRILENTGYIIFMTIVTLYALFGDDLRLL